MLTHGDWHDFTVSILECKEIMKIYRDHLYGLNIAISYCHTILYYTTSLLTKRYFPLLTFIHKTILLQYLTNKFIYYKNLLRNISLIWKSLLIMFIMVIGLGTNVAFDFRVCRHMHTCYFPKVSSFLFSILRRWMCIVSLVYLWIYTHF